MTRVGIGVVGLLLCWTMQATAVPVRCGVVDGRHSTIFDSGWMPAGSYRAEVLDRIPWGDEWLLITRVRNLGSTAVLAENRRTLCPLHSLVLRPGQARTVTCVASEWTPTGWYILLANPENVGANLRWRYLVCQR